MTLLAQNYNQIVSNNPRSTLIRLILEDKPQALFPKVEIIKHTPSLALQSIARQQSSQNIGVTKYHSN